MTDSTDSRWSQRRPRVFPLLGAFVFVTIFVARERLLHEELGAVAEATERS